MLSPFFSCLYSPADRGHDPRRWDGGPLLLLLICGGELSGQGIRLSVLEARAIRKGKIKTTEKQGPPSVAWVEALRKLEVFQISVVGPDQERMLGPL